MSGEERWQARQFPRPAEIRNHIPSTTSPITSSQIHLFALVNPPLTLNLLAPAHHRAKSAATARDILQLGESPTSRLKFRQCVLSQGV